MNKKDFIHRITMLGKSILPEDSSLWLYGSQARNEAHEDSDWDLLIMLNKDKSDFEDFGKFAYPFTEIGVQEGQVIIPQIYTRKQWAQYAFTPFEKNVEHDKIVLI